MVGPPKILTEDHGLVILKLSVGLGRYCAELQHGTVWGPCLGTLPGDLTAPVTRLCRKLHRLDYQPLFGKMRPDPGDGGNRA